MAFFFVLFPAPIRWLLLPSEIPVISTNQCCELMLHSRSPRAQSPVTGSIYTVVHGSGSQLGPAQLGGSAYVPVGCGSAPCMFVHSGPKQQKLRGGGFFLLRCLWAKRACPTTSLASHCPKQVQHQWGRNTLSHWRSVGSKYFLCNISNYSTRSHSLWWSAVTNELQVDSPWGVPLLLWCSRIAKPGQVVVFLPGSFTLSP